MDRSVIFWSLFVNVFCCVWKSNVVSGNENVPCFTEPSYPSVLRHIAYDNNSLYVTAVDTLYRLSTKLELTKAHQTGPVLDASAPCSPNADEPLSNCSQTNEQVSRYSQLLLVDSFSKRLVECSNLHNGSCEFFDLETLAPISSVKNVVPSDARDVAVALIDVGRSVLYVGASVSPDSEDRLSYPLISARNLSSLEPLFATIDLVRSVSNAFSIQFVTSFEHANFVYFFARHTLSSSGEFATFLLRMCKNDPTKSSFVEIPVECSRNGSSFPLLRDAVLAPYPSSGSASEFAVYAVFSTDNNPAGAGHSAVCVFPIVEVNRAFQSAIRRCFNGEANLRPSYIPTENHVCINMDVADGSPSGACGIVKENSPIAGTTALRPNETFLLPDTSVTCLSSSLVNDVTVLFVGTSQGRILKLSFDDFESNDERWHLDSLPVPSETSQPVKEIIVGSSADDLYLLTDKSLCKVPAYRCSSARTCGECVQDPHCGWCMKDKRCTHEKECPPLGGMNIWLKRSGQCPMVTTLEPSVLPLNLFEQTSVSVTVKHIPEAVPVVNCSVMDRQSNLNSPVAASHEQMADGLWRIVCAYLVSPPGLSDSTSVNLTLIISLNGLRWFETHLTVFDCSRLNSCTSCLSPMSPCSWCAKDHLCRHSSESSACSAGSNASFAVNHSSSCARVEPHNGSTLVLSSGNLKSFQFVVYNILPFHLESDGALKCRFKSGVNYTYTNVTSPTTTFNRQSRQILTCDSVLLEYPGDVASVSVPFDLVWGPDSNLVIDSASPVEVEVFKCQFKASNCGHCLLLDQVYECVWCTDKCVQPSSCDDPAYLVGTGKAVCPNQKIFSFSPKGGPLGGQTVLTINGMNLGRSHSDLTIHVAGESCAVLEEGYVETERVLCQTLKVNRSCNGTISVSVRTITNTTESEDVFTYKDPNITKFSPRKGPLSGGTRVSATGTNLDYGSNVSVIITSTTSSKSFFATVIGRNETQLDFIMPQMTPSFTTTATISLQVDQNRVVKLEGYSYAEDPTIQSVSPRVALMSGGNKLEVRGASLNSILQPQLVLYIGSGNVTTMCRIPEQSNTFVNCPMPDLTGMDFDPNEKLRFNFGFVMDDVRQLLHSNFGPIEYFPNPVIKKFESPVVFHAGSQLRIYGQNLSIFQQFTDFSISINGLKCTSLDYTPTMISCEPPKPPHEPKDLNADGDALVKITLGNFDYEVGYLSYYDYGLSTAAIISIVCGIAIPLFIVLCVLFVCLCRRRRGKSMSPMLSRIMMDGSRNNRTNNSYTKTEMQPLREHPHESEDPVGNNPDIDNGLFIQSLLRKIENPRRRNAAREILVARERLEMGNVIGRGHFSCVYVATLKDATMRNSIQVAAKTIEGPEFDERTLETILRESVAMRNFNHPRLVSLIGLCLSCRTSPVVILPFMANGNLRTYIKDKSKNFTARQLLLMSQQVAEGMSYLSSRELVHRNLAARNCLLDNDLEVKVSDFVLCHELFEQGLQYGTNDDWAKLPIRWMAPETLEGCVFTSASDVWAFGVLMWELMTRGITPYMDIPLNDIKMFLHNGQRLKKPKYCPETVYRIMLDCWQRVAERRPTFPDLVNRLEVLLNPPRKRQSNDLATEEEPLYVNTTDPGSPSYLRPSAGAASPYPDF